MLNPNIIDNIDDPPYDNIGNGAPTIGSNPKTIDMLTKIYKKIAEANPKQKSFAKKLFA